jgi:hypothetical protein
MPWVPELVLYLYQIVEKSLQNEMKTKMILGLLVAILCEWEKKWIQTLNQKPEWK